MWLCGHRHLKSSYMSMKPYSISVCRLNLPITLMNLPKSQRLPVQTTPLSWGINQSGQVGYSLAAALSLSAGANCVVHGLSTDNFKVISLLRSVRLRTKNQIKYKSTWCWARMQSYVRLLFKGRGTCQIQSAFWTPYQTLPLTACISLYSCS
jgi:hypothetical protein